MTGNVWELVWDGFLEPYPAGPATDPTGPADLTARGARGGSFLNAGDDVRIAVRIGVAPNSHGVAGLLGFRLVRTVR
jgi:formylglycine-generating enzyme required for sulfatase activity